MSELLTSSDSKQVAALLYDKRLSLHPGGRAFEFPKSKMRRDIGLKRHNIVRSFL
jgi:hypothetical protein